MLLKDDCLKIANHHYNRANTECFAVLTKIPEKPLIEMLLVQFEYKMNAVKEHESRHSTIVTSAF
jgi:hypothetical protein